MTARGGRSAAERFIGGICNAYHIKLGLAERAFDFRGDEVIVPHDQDACRSCLCFCSRGVVTQKRHTKNERYLHQNWMMQREGFLSTSNLPRSWRTIPCTNCKPDDRRCTACKSKPWSAIPYAKVRINHFATPIRLARWKYPSRRSRASCVDQELVQNQRQLTGRFDIAALARDVRFT